MDSAWGYLICDGGGGEDTCRLSMDPMTDIEARDGCVCFPLIMSSEDTLRFWQEVPWNDKEGGNDGC